MKGFARHRLDAALAACALAFGWVSLLYPFGRDQSLFFYIGREWFLRGAIPYRDAIEHKPPGIFVIHGILLRIFGEAMWPIRLFDLGLVLFIGWACAALLAPAPRPRGLVGTSVLLVAVLYYGFFPFWDTAQCESVCLALGLGAIVAAARIQRVPLSHVVAGIVCGAAVCVKPPVAWFVLAAAITVGLRTLDWGRALRQAWSRDRLKALALGWARFGAGVAVFPLLMIGYFAAHGAAGELALWLVRVNKYYVQNERGVSELSDIWIHTRGIFHLFAPYSSVFLAAAVVGIVRARIRDERESLVRYAIAFGLFVAAYGSVLMQLKFYRYHCVAFVGPAALLGGALYLDLRALVQERSVSDRAVTLGFAVAFVSLYALSPLSADLWWRTTRDGARYLAGSITRAEFTEDFTIPELFYSFTDSERAGLWLRDHTKPDDNVAVRAFEPQLYAVAHRRYHGRFFWTNFITDPRRSLLHEQWLAEETAQVDRDPPIYVVTLADDAEVYGTSWYLPRGYREVERFGVFRVLARQK
ncbi:MAG: hypothetical protein JWM74_6168 [Myxococcaceae bacterium]|nr:hypothetical protein [Myxococcaceae bacterium]